MMGGADCWNGVPKTIQRQFGLNQFLSSPFDLSQSQDWAARDRLGRYSRVLTGKSFPALGRVPTLHLSNLNPRP